MRNWATWFEGAFASSRDLVRCIHVCQTGAGDAYSALPGISPVHSDLMLIMEQRRLGVPLSVMREQVGRPYKDGLAFDEHGDAPVALHMDRTSRHDACVRVWARACRAALTTRVEREDFRSRQYGTERRPDVTLFGLGDGLNAHRLLDIKVWTSIDARGYPRYAEATHEAFGGVADAARRRVASDYFDAVQRNGHTAVAVLHSPFGGIEPEALALLNKLDKEVQGRLDDEDAAPWTARNFSALYKQLLSIAVQKEVATQILDASRRAAPSAADPR